MGKKSKGENKIIMRHILEVRLSKRLFSFMDFRGRMIDYMNGKLETDQIRLQGDGSRFDVADDDLVNLYFFSLENFGFQSELNGTFSEFNSGVKNLIAALKSFEDYKISDGLVRIGTKSIILYHRKNDNSQSIKDAYKNILINNHEKLAELSKSRIIDTAHTFDLKLNNSNANVLTGPVTIQEAVQKFFTGEKIGKKYSERFSRENGMLVAIDVAGNTPELIKDFDALEEQVISQVAEIETIFNGFKELFEGEKN